MMTAEQLLAAHKANIETLFDLTSKAFDGVEKLIELNLQVAKASMSEAADAAQAGIGAKDAQEWVALQTGLLQPAAEKAAAYSRHLYDIAAATGAEISRVAEGQFVEAQRNFINVVDGAVKNAPAGTEGAAALVKSALAAATNAYESVHKAAKQATDVAEANFQAMSNNIANTAVKAAQGSGGKPPVPGTAAGAPGNVPRRATSA